MRRKNKPCYDVTVRVSIYNKKYTSWKIIKIKKPNQI